jgi:hypothetical protein
MPLMRLAAPPMAVIQEADAPSPPVGVAPGDAPKPAATAAATKPAVTPDLNAVLIGYAAVLIGAIGGILLWKWRDPATFTPGSGISVFAPLYILAQAIERFLEPFSNLLNAAAPDSEKPKKRKDEALEMVHLALVGNRLDEAAKWQRVVDRIRRNTAVIAWGLASLLAMLLSGLFGLFLLRLIGFTSVPEEVDIVITGLAVGSGTKPLHDLISNLQQSKEQKQDPPEKQAA